MIASLSGQVTHIGFDHLVVVVGGVGFKVYVPFNTVPAALGDSISLFTLLIVREDALTLYGFGTTHEREIFERLISVNGVGPRIALAILGTMSIERLTTAVASGQHEALTRVPGIGKKTAEKIVFELRDKLTGADGLIPAASGGLSDINKDVMDALTSFGYSVSEAQAAIKSIPLDTPDDFEERLRRALQYFV
ncbi:Holliday junction branch migration protein RuvA [Anaerolineae bacterium CFX9]|nr:Holliday junction branch migration protein RuvA [Anaerolineae bacterium CFX9]